MKEVSLRTVSVLAGASVCVLLAQFYDQRPRVLGLFLWLAMILVIAVCFWKWADDEEKSKKQLAADRNREQEAELKKSRTSKPWIHRIAVFVASLYWSFGLLVVLAVLFANPLVDHGVSGWATVLVGVFGIYSTSFLFVLGKGAFVLRSASVLAGIGALVKLVQAILAYRAGDTIVESLILLLLFAATAPLFWNAADIEIKRKDQVRSDRTRGIYVTRKELGPANPWGRAAAVCFTALYWYFCLTSIHAMLQSTSVSDQALSIGALLAIGIALVYSCVFLFASGTLEVRPIRAWRNTKIVLLFWMSPGIAFLALVFGHIAWAVALLSVFLFLEINQLRRDAMMLFDLQAHCTSVEIEIDIRNLVRHPLFVKTHQLAQQEREGVPEFEEWATNLEQEFLQKVESRVPDHVHPTFNIKNESGRRCLTVSAIQRGDLRLVVNGTEMQSVDFWIFIKRERAENLFLTSKQYADVINHDHDVDGDEESILDGSIDSQAADPVDDSCNDERDNDVSAQTPDDVTNDIDSTVSVKDDHKSTSKAGRVFYEASSFTVRLRIVNGSVVLEAGPFTESALSVLHNPMIDCDGVGRPKVAADQPLCRIPIMFCGRSNLFTSWALGFSADTLNVSHGILPDHQSIKHYSIRQHETLWDIIAKYEAARSSRIMPKTLTGIEVRDARLWQEENLAAVLSGGLVKTGDWNSEEKRWRSADELNYHPCDEKSLRMYGGFIADEEPIVTVYAVDHYNNQVVYLDTSIPHAGP